ncbi:MAG: radical SAM protein [Spirochaetaceae bacterium]|jgi:DNA repair photolyase|nr:radical SAM protein [Spirochaetaceae bacterium]
MHFAAAKSLLSSRNGMNLVRGCVHGCIYCDSRSKCYNMQHDFEDVEIKRNAAELLEAALRKKRHPCMIGTGSMSDPYIPIPESLALTRRCIELVDKYNFGWTMITKSPLFLNDIELLDKINRKTKCVVQMTMTTYDEALCPIIEPNVAGTKERFEALMECKRRGIPTVVWFDPILPFINDTEENIQGILDYCIEAAVQGIIYFGAGLTLRQGNREYFYQKLDEHFPGLKAQYEKKYGYNYHIASPKNYHLSALFYKTCKEHNIMCRPSDVFLYLAEFPETGSGQGELF